MTIIYTNKIRRKIYTIRPDNDVKSCFLYDFRINFELLNYFKDELLFYNISDSINVCSLAYLVHLLAIRCLKMISLSTVEKFPLN